MRLTIRWSLVGVGLSLALLAVANSAAAQSTTVYACVNKSSGTVKIVGPTTVCGNNESLLTWNQTGPAGTDAPVAYGVGAVSVKRGAAGTPAIWGAYSTRLGSPLGADLVSSQAAVLGDTASGAFRFTCRDTHAVCEVSIAAATLSNTAGETVYVYPRVLMQKQSYTSGGPQTYCEYGDGSTGAAPAPVPTQVSTATPVYTPLLINIGGSADCSGPVATAGDVSVITVGPGYYDVFATFVFKKP
jgi:hypothetical protein